MTANHPEGSISTDLVRMLLGGAPRPGGEVDSLLRLAGISWQDLQSPGGRIPLSQLTMIWTELERGAGDPNLGLHLGELRDGLPTGHVLFAAMWNSPTLGQALERYCRFHDLMGDLVQPRLESEGDRVLLTLAPRAGVTLHRQHTECIFSLLVSILSRLSGAPFPGTVSFSHQAPADTSEHLRIFGAGLRFARPREEVSLPASFLEQPIAAADQRLLGVLEQYAEELLRDLRPEATWAGKVARLLSQGLCDGRPDLGHVARQLGVSNRTLQARLKEEGTTYQAVLDNVRKELALSYLKDESRSLVEVAFLLGYADQSAFNHAFRRWTGASPRSFRSQPR